MPGRKYGGRGGAAAKSRKGAAEEPKGGWTNDALPPVAETAVVIKTTEANKKAKTTPVTPVSAALPDMMKEMKVEASASSSSSSSSSCSSSSSSSCSSCSPGSLPPLSTTPKNPNFGVIFHWGIYSVPAYDDPDSAAKRKIQNGSEWYAKRLWSKKGDFRPCSGWQATHAFHNEKFPGKDYSEFAKEFFPNTWDPDSWMKLCADCGASYVILTSKHHDGYCLWPTQATTGGCSKLDLIQLFKTSAEKYGLTFGLYYSWGEFASTVNSNYLDNIVKRQIDELITRYHPMIWWFDGHWWFRAPPAKHRIQLCCERMRKEIPGTILNDRLGINFLDANDLGNLADYRVYDDRHIPKVKPNVPWEHINTIGYSWGRNKQQTEKDYKTVAELTQLYTTTRACGGKFLLNLGPDADGSLDPIEVQRLTEFSRCMREAEEKQIPQLLQQQQEQQPQVSPPATRSHTGTSSKASTTEATTSEATG